MKMFDIAPQGGLVRYLLGYVHLMRGRLAEALGEFDAEPIPRFRWLGLALAHHALGHAAESEEALAELVRRESTGGATQIAWAYAYRGDKDRAFEWLERASSRHDAPSWLARHPLLRNLHADPRWQPFIAKLGLKAVAIDD